MLMNELKISCEMNIQHCYHWDFQFEAGEKDGDDRNVANKIHNTCGWLDGCYCLQFVISIKTSQLDGFSYKLGQID